MSRTASQPEDLETGNVGGGDHSERPRSAPNPTLEREFLPDGSGPLFSMYTKIGEEKDGKIVKLWQKDADGILIFTGLFSTAVATFLTVSIQDLKPPPHQASEFYLEKIYNRLGNTDPSYAFPLDAAAKPPTFSPPRYAIWVNSLWFLSFAISLTYATLAMMLQQWGRRYIRVTQQLRSSPHKRARIRAFFSDAIDGLHVLWVIEGVRAMTHLSMFLFFAGLLIYLFNICHAAFVAVVWWVALSTLVYVSFTLLPIFRPNSPYYAPLSPTLWFIFACTSFAVFQVLSSQVFSFLGPNTVARFRGSRDYYRRRFLEDIRKIAEESASRQSSVIDVHVLESIFYNLSEDGAWEKYFEAVPGFLSSKLVNGVRDHLPEEFREKFGQALGGFLDRTFSFNSVTELVRGGRLVICLNAAHAALGVNGVSRIFTDILSGRWPELLQSVEIGHSLRRWSNSGDEQVTWDVRRIVAQIIVSVREHDDRWISLAKAEYGIPGHVLREYIGHRDSALLSTLIHMTREAFHNRSWTPWILSSLAEFNIRDTFPELQHAFCALWNDIVLEAWNEEGPENIPVRILREMRHACIALHQDTDAVLMTFSASTHHFDPVLRQPRSYRVCKVASHRQSLTMRTPVTGSFTVPSLILDQFAASPPHPSPIESDHTPDGSTAPQPGEEANVIVESPPTTDHTPHPNHTQEFISPPPAVNSVPIAQAASIIGPSVPESIEMVVTRDPDLLVPDETSHDPRQQPAPAAEIAAVATMVRPDDPAPQLQISEMGDISQAPAETSLTSAHPDSVPTPISLSSRPPSSFVPDPGDDPDKLQPITLAAILSHPPENNEQHDATVPCASLDTNVIPSIDNLTPWSIPIAPPTIVVSDSLSSRVLHPAPSSLESAPIQPDHILGTPRSPPSSLTTSSSRIPSQITSLSFAQASTSIGALGPYDDTGDPNPPIPMMALPHSTQTAMPAHDVVSNALPLEEGQVQRDPDKLS